jgi:hypothetical protein
MEIGKYLFLIAVVVWVSSRFFSSEFEKSGIELKEQVKTFEEDLNRIGEELKSPRPSLIDGGHIFRYYFPGEETKVVDLYRVNNKASVFATRENYQFINQDSLIETKQYEAIVINKKRNYSIESFQQLKDVGYIMESLNEYYLFYLPQ